MTTEAPPTPQTPQVDAIAVIDSLAAEIAALPRRAVIAEQRAVSAESRAARLEEIIEMKEKK